MLEVFALLACNSFVDVSGKLGGIWTTQGDDLCDGCLLVGRPSAVLEELRCERKVNRSNTIHIPAAVKKWDFQRGEIFMN